MIGEAWLKKREKRGEQRGEQHKDSEWRAWYEVNRQHMNGTSPPPPPPQDK